MAGSSALKNARISLFLMYSKPYLTIDEQINLLRSRGMKIENIDKASEYLQRIGYYRLSAYWFPFRVRDVNSGKPLDTFKPETTFANATDLYAFDKKLRLIAIDALERIEISLRTEVALTLGEHDPIAHRVPKFMDGRFVESKSEHVDGQSKHNSWLRRLDERARDSKDEFAVHFRKNYPDSKMPIWIAVELLDFGPLSHLISGMRHRDISKICSNYNGIIPPELKSWVWALSFVRNICAHHGRLWNKNLIAQPILRKQSLHPHMCHLLSVPGRNTRFYAVATIMQFMLSTVNPRSNWKSRFIDHIESFPVSSHLSLNSAGFPQDWRAYNIWR